MGKTAAKKGASQAASLICKDKLEKADTACGAPVNYAVGGTQTTQQQSANSARARVHALCIAHHIRELTRAAEDDGQKWAAEIITLLLAIKKEVDDSLDGKLSTRDL